MYIVKYFKDGVEIRQEVAGANTLVLDGLTEVYLPEGARVTRDGVITFGPVWYKPGKAPFRELPPHPMPQLRLPGDPADD